MYNNIVITLKDLAFTFAILGIGLAGATVVFFVEVRKGRRTMPKNHALGRWFEKWLKVEFY